LEEDLDFDSLGKEKTTSLVAVLSIISAMSFLNLARKREDFDTSL
jgi:hypothetical protein